MLKCGRISAQILHKGSNTNNAAGTFETADQERHPPRLSSRDVEVDDKGQLEGDIHDRDVF